jgi:hypothetical protein
VRSNCSAARLAGLSRAVLCFCGGKSLPASLGGGPAGGSVRDSRQDRLCPQAGESRGCSTQRAGRNCAALPRARERSPFAPRKDSRKRTQAEGAERSDVSMGLHPMTSKTPTLGAGGREALRAAKNGQLQRDGVHGNHRAIHPKFSRIPSGHGLPTSATGCIPGTLAGPRAGERRAASGAYHRALPARLPSRAAKHAPSQLSRCTFTFIATRHQGGLRTSCSEDVGCCGGRGPASRHRSQHSSRRALLPRRRTAGS